MSDKLEPFTDTKSELSLRDEAIARIERRLDEISKQVDDIVRHMDKMCASWRSTRKRMNRMEAQLYGNGHTGLTAKVNAILYVASGTMGLIALVLANLVAAWFR